MANDDFDVVAYIYGPEYAISESGYLVDQPPKNPAAESVLALHPADAKVLLAALACLRKEASRHEGLAPLMEGAGKLGLLLQGIVASNR